MRSAILAFIFSGCVSICFAQQTVKGFEIVPAPAKKQVSIMYDGKLITAYCYYDSIYKPILFPLNTVDGITVTRGFPIAPVAGEKTDHPHHTGMWMNYESVNGLDFWNNSNAIEPSKKPLYGSILHGQIIRTVAGMDSAMLTATAQWKSNDGEVQLNETTDYIFKVKGVQLFIERRTKLTAAEKEVVFKDVKDGFFAIRVARELEMPSKEPATYVDAHGNQTKVPVDNNGVTGWYVSSEGKEGDSVWGTKGKWAMLRGKKNNKNISITIFDHPSNPGYPTYWHARGYGLFAANPLGRKIFSNGKEELNLRLKAGSSVTFRYLVLIQSGKNGSPDDMNRIANEFEKE